jgi:cation transport regulator ChaC
MLYPFVMALLFSYGSNHPEQLAQRLGHEVVSQGALVREYGRAFRGASRTWGGAGTATLIPMTGTTTYGLVIDVTKADIDLLDRYEGVPTVYNRQKIKVTLQSGESKTAWVYISTRTDFNPPSREYLKAIVKTINTHWTSKSGSSVKVSDIPIR